MFSVITRNLWLCLCCFGILSPLSYSGLVVSTCHSSDETSRKLRLSPQRPGWRMFFVCITICSFPWPKLHINFVLYRLNFLKYFYASAANKCLVDLYKNQCLYSVDWVTGRACSCKNLYITIPEDFFLGDDQETRPNLEWFLVKQNTK